MHVRLARKLSLTMQIVRLRYHLLQCETACGAWVKARVQNAVYRLEMGNTTDYTAPIRQDCVQPKLATTTGANYD